MNLDEFIKLYALSEKITKERRYMIVSTDNNNKLEDAIEKIYNKAINKLYKQSLDDVKIVKEFTDLLGVNLKENGRNYPFGFPAGSSGHTYYKQSRSGLLSKIGKSRYANALVNLNKSDSEIEEECEKELELPLKELREECEKILNKNLACIQNVEYLESDNNLLQASICLSSDDILVITTSWNENHGRYFSPVVFLCNLKTHRSEREEVVPALKDEAS